MSYGIPSLYIAATDSELSDYASKYNHAKCVSHDKLDEAEDFILELYKNKELHELYSENAEKASKNYRRPNADRIVQYYLDLSPKTVERKQPVVKY